MKELRNIYRNQIQSIKAALRRYSLADLKENYGSARERLADIPAYRLAPARIRVDSGIPRQRRGAIHNRF